MRQIAALLGIALIPLSALAAPGPAAPPVATEAPGTAFGFDLDSGPDSASAVPAGGSWVRITADWSALEPARGKFAWTNLDTAVKGAADAKEQLVVVIANTPKWAALSPEAPEEVWRHQPPQELKDWQAFVGAAAARYRGRVAAWQFEPALDFAVFRGTVVDYLQMLHAARLAVRQADPPARIVAASPVGLDLAYTKHLLARAGDDFDIVALSPKGRAPQDVLEALSTMRERILTDARHALWVERTETGDAAGGPPEAAVGNLMVQMAAVDLAGGVTREFWAGRQLSPRLAPVRETILKMLNGVRFVGWLPRGPGVHALIMTDGQTPVAVVWSTEGAQKIPLESAGGLRVVGATGTAAPQATADSASTVLAGAEPVFVQGLAPSVLAEAAQAAKQGPPRIPRDSAHDFSRADTVSVTLGADNIERGLYNRRFRRLPSGAVVPVTLEGVSAVRTNQPTDAVYVYFDVDHSFVYYVDGRQDLLVTVEVHRAGAAHQVGFNLLYDSMTGYRFSPWQWIEPGAGWATYTVKLTDANFSSTWGWDFAINGAGDKKGDLVVRSVTVRKMPRTN